jgi:hypothetical protein
MKLTSSLVALSAVALLASAVRVDAQGAVGVGQKVPDRTFTQLLNNDGRMSMDSFRGKVIAVDFWGNH